MTSDKTLSYSEVLAKGYDWETRVEFVRKNIVDFLTLAQVDDFYSTSDLARHLLACAGASADLMDPLLQTVMAVRRDNAAIENYGFVVAGKKKKMYGKLQTTYLWKHPKTVYKNQTPNAEEPVFVPATENPAVLSLADRVNAIEQELVTLRAAVSQFVDLDEATAPEVEVAKESEIRDEELMNEAEEDTKDENVSDLAKAFAKNQGSIGVDTGGYAGQNDVHQTGKE